jgi:hypothetical protein
MGDNGAIERNAEHATEALRRAAVRNGGGSSVDAVANAQAAMNIPLEGGLSKSVSGERNPIKGGE